jgi:hypothetical protein
VVICVDKYIVLIYLLFIGVKNMVVNGLPQQNNPLASFMRQPKIYIKLPSQGNYWPPGSLDISETGEYPVYSMTAKDELMLKVPDAVLSGQAVVDVIQHCMPNIKNAWQVPSIDIDVILIAIRLATYGEKMTTPIKLGESGELDYEVDLRIVMDTLQNQITWNPIISINNDLTVYVKPLNYKQISDSAIKTFETQRIIQIANDGEMSDEDKIKTFKDSFKKLTEVTIGVVESSIFRIDSSAGSTEDRSHIKEFVENVDKDIFNKMQNHLDELREVNAIKPLVVPATQDMKEQGYDKDTIEVPLMFDPATFFV